MVNFYPNPVLHMPFSRSLRSREKGEGRMVFAFLGGFAAQKRKNHPLREFFTV